MYMEGIELGTARTLAGVGAFLGVREASNESTRCSGVYMPARTSIIFNLTILCRPSVVCRAHIDHHMVMRPASSGLSHRSVHSVLVTWT